MASVRKLIKKLPKVSKEDSLKKRLKDVRLQLEELRAKRDRLRYHLGESRAEIQDLKASHQQLWAQHFCDRYSLETPPAEIVAHIAHRRDSDFDAGLEMLITGFFAAKRLAAVFHEHAVPAQNVKVLDFGCGCARVTRFLDQLAPDAELAIAACDIDSEAISWCRQHLSGVANFFLSGDCPPLPCEENEFDVITVLSVFTHLPEDMQFQWLQSLRSHLKPSGLLLATIHGPSFHRFVPENMKAEFQKTGFAYANLGETPDLPDYYLSSFHSHRYIQERWSAEGFEVIEIKEQFLPQATVRQDLIVLRKI